MIKSITWRIVIHNFHPVTLNELMKECKTRRATFGRRSRLKRTDANIIAAFSLNFPKASGPRSVKIVITLEPGQRTPDGDAFFKSTHDALVKAKMLVNDSPAWCLGLPTEFVRGERKSTTIELIDLEES